MPIATQLPGELTDGNTGYYVFPDNQTAEVIELEQIFLDFFDFLRMYERVMRIAILSGPLQSRS